jgi:hypothetical protein
MRHVVKPKNRPPPNWLRALGQDNLPAVLFVQKECYRYVRTFKHDFFAATGLYQGTTGLVVLKVGRKAPVLGVPLGWVGAFLARHEAEMLHLAEGTGGAPRLVGRWGETGIVRGFIEGRPLARTDAPNDEFFPILEKMLAAYHERGAAVVDLEKPENILLGADGKPYLIDFQIAWYLPTTRGGATWAARWLLRALQEADWYHLMKHWRRLRPDQLSPEQCARAGRPPFWIRWHRAIFGPLTRLRQGILVLLGARETVHGRSPG